MQTTSAPLAPPPASSERARATTGASASHRVAVQVREVCALHSIEAEQLGLLLASAPELRDHSRGDLADAAHAIVDEGPVPDLAVLRAATRVVEEDIGHGLSAAGLERPIAAIGRRGGDALGAVLGLLCGYVVIGGLLEGHSDLLSAVPGPVALLAFATVLSVLALFEALHVSVVQLKTSDLGALADAYPRTYALQRRFRSDLGTQRFLAGRQMVVIVTVFFVAGMSSFRSLSTLPLTDVPIPSLLRPLLDLGVPGALFTLWIGQLVPQFVATRRPLAFMERAIVPLAFRVAMALEAIGFARPGFWMSGHRADRDAIPTSPSVRWSQSAQEVDGVGIVVMRRAWTIGPEASMLEASTTTAFFADGRESHTDRSLMLPAAASELALHDRLVTADGVEVGLLQTGCDEERLRSGDRRLHKTAVAQIGAFRAGDVLKTRLRARFDAEIRRDAVLVDQPVRMLLLSVTVTGCARHVPPARLIAYQVGDGTTDILSERSLVTLFPQRRSDGDVVFEHVVPFPDPGTLFTLDWEALY
jgi:Silicon transporter